MNFLKKNHLILAPVAGVTDTVFRRIAKRMGADVVVSEMVSADGLHYKSSNTASLLKFEEYERPIGIQLFGSDPSRLAAAAQFVCDNVRPDFIDLNSGCPVNKVVKNGSGSALLKDPKLFAQIVTAMSRAVKIPVTVKIRSGWNKHEWVDEEFARIAQDCGASAITLHPRSQTMMFTGHSFWERIAIVKNAVSIPVIGNGDIVNGESALKMISETNCDAIMIARASFGNPWVFAEIKSALNGNAYTPPTLPERKEIILEHIRTYREVYKDGGPFGELKKNIAWYIKSLPQASMIRSKVFAQSCVDGVEVVVESLLGV